MIIDPELRGCGLGRQLMEEAERHTAMVGYETLHLSTHDKQGFYSRLGYHDGPVVSGWRKCVARLSDDQVIFHHACTGCLYYSTCSSRLIH